MKKVNNQKGFTMVELILVMTILGILAVAALPSFIDVTGQAGTAASAGVIGAVREGISLQMANNAATTGAPTAPADLDADDASPWFESVIANGVTDTNWSQTGANQWTYTPQGGGAATICNYVAGTGAFTCP